MKNLKTMWIFGLLIFAVSVSSSSNRLRRQGQEPGRPDSGCVLQCVTVILKGVQITMQNATGQGPVDQGTSLVCSNYDKHDLDQMCRSYAEGKACFNNCAAGPIKDIALNGVKFLKFLCEEKKTDFDKLLPCLGNSCLAATASCKPLCGSVKKDSKKKINQILGSFFNFTDNDHTDNNLDLTHVDLFGTANAIGENCQYASCFLNCSKDVVITKCGAAAFDLYEELVWKTVSSLTQSVSSLGLGTMWPDECKVLGAAYINKNADMITTTVLTTPGLTSTAPNSTQHQTPNATLNRTKCKTKGCDNGDFRSAATIPTLSIFLWSISICSLLQIIRLTKF